MTASELNPVYKVRIVSGNVEYDVSSVLVSIDMTESKKQISQSVVIRLTNVKLDGSWLSSIIKVRDRVFISVSDGYRVAQVFSGIVWSRDYQSSLLDREITIKCYDNLIYLQESEAYNFFEEGNSTSDIMYSICGEWGVLLSYKYESITHAKMALRGTLADIFITDILDLVKDRTGKDYVILSDHDVMVVQSVGQNSTVHKVEAGKNAISVVSKCTMDGMVTKVAILGTADREDRRAVHHESFRNTDEYGTLQKIIARDKNTTLEAAQSEAENILDENSSPKWEYEVTAIDIPWARKGDKIYVNAGDLAGKHLIVTDINRSIDSKGKKIIFDCIEA